MEKFDPLEYIGFDHLGKKILMQSKLFVKDARKRKKYVDDKPVKNQFDGTALTIQFDRNQEFANSEFKLFVNEVYDPEDIIDKDVSVRISDVKVYARSANGFANLNVSLYGSVKFLNEENAESEIDDNNEAQL